MAGGVVSYEDNTEQFRQIRNLYNVFYYNSYLRVKLRFSASGTGYPCIAKLLSRAEVIPNDWYFYYCVLFMYFGYIYTVAFSYTSGQHRVNVSVKKIN